MSSSSVSFTHDNKIHDDEPHDEDTHHGSTTDESDSGSEASSDGENDAKPSRPALSRAATLAEEDENFQAIVDTLHSWAKKRPTDTKPYEWDISPKASDSEAGKDSDSDSDSSVMRKSVRFNDKKASESEPVAESPLKSTAAAPLHRAGTGYFDHADGEASETVSKTRKAKLEYLQRADSNVSEKPEKTVSKLSSDKVGSFRRTDFKVSEESEKSAPKPSPANFRRSDSKVSEQQAKEVAPKPTDKLGFLRRTDSKVSEKPKIEAPKANGAKVEQFRRADSNISEKLKEDAAKPIPVVEERKGAFLNKLAAFQSKNDPPLKPTGIVTKTTFAPKQPTQFPKTVELESTPIEKPSKPSKQPAPEPVAPTKLWSKHPAPKALAESYYDNVQGIEEREKEVIENLEQPEDHTYRPTKSQSSAFANARKLFDQAAAAQPVPPKPVQSVRPKKVIKVNTQAFEKR